MPNRDIIVVGASAGGIEPLQLITRGLPGDLPASLFVVVHIPARSMSMLPAILSRSGPLPARHAIDGEAIEPGRIYVTPPDRHLVVERDHVRVTSGPKEQHHRPCINVTFRSAASAYGDRVAGVVLSGELDDGTAGLFEIERRGGACIVQNPEEAASPSMPLSALREVAAQYVASAKDMGALLAKLATGDRKQQETMPLGSDETAMGRQLTDITCPECRGTIWQVSRGASKDFECRVGHKYSVKSMLTSHATAQENVLYAAVVALLEGATLADRLSNEFEGDAAERLREQARKRTKHAETLQEILREGISFSLD